MEKSSREQHDPEEGIARVPFSPRARLRSFAYAFAGCRHLLSSQHNAWVHGAATVLVVLCALVFRVSRLEWVLLVLAMGLVWAMEAVNTAVEFLGDEVSQEYRPRIGKAKDVAAFGVLAAAVTAVIVGLLIFLPRLFA